MNTQIEKTLTGVTYTASGTAVYMGGMTANEFAAIGGLIVAVLAFAAREWRAHKRERREAELHEARMQEIRERAQHAVFEERAAGAERRGEQNGDQ